jgi:hypothetical protein
VIPSHDPGRISRLRPVWRKLPSVRGKSLRERGRADFHQRFFGETPSQNTSQEPDDFAHAGIGAGRLLGTALCGVFFAPLRFHFLRVTTNRREVPIGDLSRCSRVRGQSCGYSMTSSASICIEIGTSIPRALAVFALITSSNLVDCCTGKSAGFAPLRMRPV